MPAKRTAHMVIFAMHIVGERAAERDILRARRDREKPAARHAERQNLLQSEARFGDQEALFPIRSDKTVQRAHVQRMIGCGQATIAVTSAIAKRQRRTVRVHNRRERMRQIATPMDSVKRLRMRWIAPPRKTLNSAHVAIQKTAPNKRPTSRLTRSLTAKMTGSSCI